MNRRLSFLFLLVANAVARAAGSAATISIAIDQPGATISPALYGLMTEEINHSYEGGLYGELIQNRTLRDDPDRPVHWNPIGQTKLSLDQDVPPQTVFKKSLLVDGDGVANEGYWGFPVRPNIKYAFSFYAKCGEGAEGKLTVSLETSDDTRKWATVVIQATNVWQRYSATLSTGDGIPSGKTNRLAIYLSSPGKVLLSDISLFPPTFNDRANGNRPDLMQLLGDLKPSFLRFPGGNYLEGDHLESRFDWKKTIGPVEKRPGHAGCWGYGSSDGFGLPEFLGWCDDLHMEPLLAVFAGYTLKHDVVPAGDGLKPYVQDALDEIEYCTGDAGSTWGKKRIEDGFEKPFDLHYIEIGNEDWFDTTNSYDGRFAQFYDAIKAKYPKLQLIATTKVTSRKPDVYDDHYYRSARRMEFDNHHYDKADRNGPKVFVGEWASKDGSPTPTLRAALADAAWLMGLENNSDLVVMSCYAPLLVNVNPGASQWSTNLIGFDALSSFGSPSYWAQQMISANKGEVVLPTRLMIRDQPTAAPVPHGKIVLATAGAAAEFKDISVSDAAGHSLLPDNASSDLAQWQLHGKGKWALNDGVLWQTRTDIGSQAHIGDRSWSSYTLRLKARKTAGDGGLLIQVHYLDDSSFVTWTVGGRDNKQSKVETTEVFDHTPVGNTTDFSLETGRWYELRVEVEGAKIKTYIDGRLTSEGTIDVGPPKLPIFAQASYSKSTGEALLKLVNATENAVSTSIDLTGATSIDPEGEATVLAGDSLDDQNSIDAPLKLSPRKERIGDAGKQFTRTLPPRSFTILRVRAR